MSGGSATAGETATTGRFVDFLRVRLAGGPRALELGRVRQVIRRPTVSRVPRSPAAVAGATTVGGDVTVAIDPAVVLGTPHRDGGIRALVVLDRTETPHPVGLLVDAVAGIERYGVESVKPADEHDAEEGPYRATIDTEDGDRVPVFDVGGLVAAVEADR